jgi:copper chaperone CopZ
MNNTNFKITGLTCGACAKLAVSRLKKVPGVQEVKIDPQSGETEVFSVADLDLEILEESLKGTPYSIAK